MRAIRSWRGLLGTLTLAGLPASAGAQAVGSESLEFVMDRVSAQLRVFQ